MTLKSGTVNQSINLYLNETHTSRSIYKNTHKTHKNTIYNIKLLSELRAGSGVLSSDATENPFIHDGNVV